MASRAKGVQFGVFLPNFGPFGDCDTLVELACSAEQCGWDGLFIWDHILVDNVNPQPIVDPWVALAAVAAETERIRIGALITPVARRRPWKLARETVSLDRLSQGRLIFAAGLGFPAHEEFEILGEDGDGRVRAEKLDEGLEILAGLWSGEPTSFSGKHYEIGPVTFLPPPAQEPRPPIWIAGWWPRKPPFRRAARWDGVFPELVGGEVPSPEHLGEIVAYVSQYRQRADAFDVVLNGYTPDPPKRAANVIEPYAEAGLTWWLERIEPRRLFSVDGAHSRILSGPPSS
jgi:alkanesulfonate monooxygenase SsuD/methylene tetrahydromethanopterin reductase-like flavin-dependent oxidoreductase (luciferase family)